MKRITIICCALLASFTLTIAGCGEDEEEAEVGDTKPPTVTEVIAVGGTSGAATNGPIMVVFSEAVDPASVQGAITLTPQASGDVSYDANTRTLTFKPKSDLQAHSKYSLTVSNVEDKAGNAMEPFIVDILTSEKDVAPPTVVKTTPSDGELEASTGPKFNIEFSERIDQAEFDPDLSLTPDVGVPPDRWVHTWSEDGKQVEIFIPLEKGLEPETDFALSIGAKSVMDLVGNEMAEGLEIEFTTAERLYEDIDPRSQAAIQQEWIYIIWKDHMDIWHIIWGGTTLPGGVNTGAGTITSEDGAIDDVNPVLWEAGDQQNLKDGVLTFSGPVNGTGGTDGLEFKVKGKTVTFDLRNAKPEWIYIGKDRKHPETTTFKLLNEDE